MTNICGLQIANFVGGGWGQESEEFLCILEMAELNHMSKNVTYCL